MPVKKIACLSVSEFAIFSNPTIRNQLKVTLTFTRLFSLLKGFALGKLLLPPSAKEPSGGVRKGRVREGSDEGPCGRSLSVPPDYEDSIVNIMKIYNKGSNPGLEK